MKKLIITVIVLITINYSGFSQNWSPLGFGLDGEVRCFYPDTARNILWVGGGFWKANHNKAMTIANWDSVNWDTLPNSLPGYITLAIINYDSSLFVGGYDGCFIFKNNQWINNPFFNGYSLSDGYVTGFEIVNNKLYAIGWFNHINGITAHGIAMYDGFNWQSVNNFPVYNPGNNPNEITTIKYYKGKLYIAGQYADSLSGGYPVFASYLDSSGWHTIGGVLHGSFININAMCIYKNNLYFAGSFLKSNGNLGDNIVMYDGVNFHEVGTGLQGGQVYDLIIYDNYLIAGGLFTNAGNINTKYLAKWDGSKWCSFGSDFDRPIIKLGVFRNELYVGCGFTVDGDSVNYIAKWIGGSYIDTCSQIYGSVYEMVNESGINISPNPAYNIINIKSVEEINKIKDIKLYNSFGQVFKIENLRKTDSNNLTINVSGLTSGFYLLSITTNKTQFVCKFVKY